LGKLKLTVQVVEFAARVVNHVAPDDAHAMDSHDGVNV
jgi:hypothetical protein